VEAMSQVIDEFKEDIAAVIMEPVMGNVGPILPEDGYLKDVRALTKEHNILLLFDEIITGFGGNIQRQPRVANSRSSDDRGVA